MLGRGGVLRGGGLILDNTVWPEQWIMAGYKYFVTSRGCND